MRYLRLRPKDPLAWDLAARMLLLAGRPHESAATARRGIDAHPGEPLLLDALGAACTVLGELDEGERAWRGLVDHYPGHATGYIGLAFIAGDRHDWEEAGRWVDEALQRHPSVDEMLQLAAFLEIFPGMRDRALSLARETVATAPKDPAAHLMVARLLGRGHPEWSYHHDVAVKYWRRRPPQMLKRIKMTEPTD